MEGKLGSFDNQLLSMTSKKIDNNKSENILCLRWVKNINFGLEALQIAKDKILCLCHLISHKIVFSFYLYSSLGWGLEKIDDQSLEV